MGRKHFLDIKFNRPLINDFPHLSVRGFRKASVTAGLTRLYSSVP
jgi:hypothetical protein